MSKFHLKKAVAETPLCCYLLDVEKTLNLNEIRIIFDSTGVVINIFEEFCCVRVPDSFWSKFLLEIFESPLNHFFHDELLCDNNGQIVFPIYAVCFADTLPGLRDKSTTLG